MYPFYPGSHKTAKFFYSACSIIFLLFYTCQAMAQGNFLVTPKRIVFDGSKRSETINIANTGKDSATFAISFVQIRMSDDGKFDVVDQPDSSQQVADKNLRFFPKSVTLGPNEAQTIKIQVIRSGKLSPGEYRSHLYFRSVSNQRPLEKMALSTADTNLSIRLVPIFGITTPIIIRVGENNTAVGFSDVVIEAEENKSFFINGTFKRKGNMSVYGDLSVDYISTKGKITQVALVKGIAVYSTNSIRHFHIPLDKIAGVNYHSGKLRLVYSDQSATPIKLAEQVIVLNENVASLVKNADMKK